MSKDAILCAFSCSKTSPCTDWAKAYYTSVPTVVAVPGDSSTAFKHEGARFAHDPWKWLKQHKVDDATRIAVVTFSAGWGFIDALMRLQYTRELVDSVLLLDGLHCKPDTLFPWVEYAKRCAIGGETMPMLLMAHSAIIPPYTSTTTTNKTVFSEGVRNCPYPAESVEFTDVTKARLALPVHITSAYGSRTWGEYPLAEWESAGNLYRYSYKGNDAPTHIFIAKHVQPLLWKQLAARWNSGGGVNASVNVDRNTYCGEGND